MEASGRKTENSRGKDETKSDDAGVCVCIVLIQKENNLG